ncbi:MAG: thermonuclease family protein [Gallionella sp.]
MNLLLAVFALALSFPAWADFTGNVVGVADGDTITVLDADKVQHKIRLTGIDAPEKKQPFGNRSKQSLSDMVFNKTVTVETDKRDRYGRELGKVLAGGKDVNLEQVRTGFAWHYKAYERTQSATDRQAYADAENEAKAAKRGLWVDAEPTPPWEWRHQQKTESHAAEWTGVGGTESQNFYADLTTVRKAGKSVQMWSMLDLKEPDTTAGKPYLSMKMLNEFDCVGEQYRFLDSLNYSGNMGGGEVVFRGGTASEWNLIPPTSAVKTLWKVACGKWRHPK